MTEESNKELIKNNTDVMVSIICLAYNHEPYIRDALESFINQQTKFRFEVLINDDASTDNTAKIIREYEIKYPEIIKAIYQKENQYNQGVGIMKTYIFPKARGKYFAFCEGDDYWISNKKLQKQVDYLESHPDCSACVHNSIYHFLSNDTKKVNFAEHNRDLTLSDVIEGGKNSYHLSSLVYRKEFALSNKPDFVKALKDVGDYPLSIYLALKGKIFFFGEAMSVYRVGVNGSWTFRTFINNEKAITHINQTIKMLEMANEYSGYKYSDLFNIKIEKQQIRILLYENKFKDIIKKYSKTFNKSYPLIFRIKVYLKYLFPFLIKIKHSMLKEKTNP